MTGRAPKGYRSKSQRRLTPARMMLYRLAVLLAFVFLELIWRTARLRVIGEDRLAALLQEHGAVVPVFWHQHLLICGRYLVARRVAGFKPGIMISPSVDGQAPTMLASLYGAHIVRASGSYTGVRAVRGMQQAIITEGISFGLTPDGPRGPRFKLKPGAIFAAQLSGKAVVPIAFAATPAKLLRTWDRFVLVPPFAKIRIVIGEPYFPPAELSTAGMEQAQRDVERLLLATYRLAREQL